MASYTVNGVQLQGTPVGGSPVIPQPKQKQVQTQSGPQAIPTQVTGAQPVANANAAAGSVSAPAPSPSFSLPGSPGGAAPPAPAAPAPAPAPLVTQTAINPNLDELKNDYAARTKTLAAGENAVDPNLALQQQRLATQLSADTTKRDIGRSTLSIADAAAGQKAVAAEGAAANGGNVAARNQQIDEAAQRRAAGASADITAAREAAKDNLVIGGQGIMSAQANLDLQRQGQTNGLIASALPVYGAQQQAQLQQAAQGLNQYQVQAQLDLQRQQQEAQRQQAEEDAWRAAVQTLPAIPAPVAASPYPAYNGGNVTLGRA